ncbi:hypothetical protein [Bradyrhizobium sp. cf659]|uniref:hypothetical protein n=1 Tax=Bradyrhizobium sp. cf659 TaxID=1761771 RepID=UPI0008EFE88D|nr:hypothetical protein [Bradyrhizobium sp. cf659]SFH82288.1 hypothetical protein SAMN04487925_101654 [Bradyrhizobium sp. cf659]
MDLTSVTSKLSGLGSAFRQRWNSAIFRTLENHPIAKVPWSAIRRIGQSRLLAFTVIVPFLGSTILFNQTVVEALSLSPELVRRWLHLNQDGGEQLNDAAHVLTLSRLYYTYFGLSFLGFGSALFGLFCPTTIKDHSSASAFQSIESQFASKPKFRIMLRQIAYESCFWDWFSEDEQLFITSPVWFRRAGAPGDFQILFHNVVLEVFGAWARENPESELDHEVYEDRHAPPDTSKLAYAMAFPNRIRSIFVDELADVAFNENTRNDVLALSYMAQDHSKPILRLCTAGCYAIGFALLLIPTVQTFYRVILSLVTNG